MYFSIFCGRRESDGLFHPVFNRAWINEYMFGSMDDDFAMFIAGGEL